MPLTLQQMNVAMQQFTLTAIGIAYDPSNASDPAYSRVRVDWPTDGQPFGAITDDVAFISCTEEDDEYDRLRDVVDADVIPVTGPITQVSRTTSYTRVWRVAWVIYGPNSFDGARSLRSALYTDSGQNQLAASEIYPVMDIAPAIRAPENFQGQWWERSDLHVFLNEAVQEVSILNAVASVEVQSFTAAGEFADQTVTE
jgi:hypothetical protein